MEPAAPAQAGRSLLERRAPALGAAAAEALAAAPADRAAARRPRRAGHLAPAGRTSCASVPIARTSIILALDVSRSMCSTDVKPNRLAVAQEAARAFVQKQPKGIRMGLVVFSGFAELTVPPTTDRKALVEAIDGLTTGHGTAIGSAMLKGLDAIAEANPNVAPVGDAPETEPPATGRPRPARRSTASCRTSSCSSPTAPTTAASSRSMRCPTRSSAGCASTRSASAPPTRRRPSCTREQLGGDVFDAGRLRRRRRRVRRRSAAVAGSSSPTSRR